jgi:RND family efflux transporter MFP subunit
MRSLLLASTLGLASLALSAAGCSHESRAGTAEVKAALPKVHVESVAVAEQRVPKLLSLTGELSSNERTDLAANASGRVIKTFVERGAITKQEYDRQHTSCLTQAAGAEAAKVRAAEATQALSDSAVRAPFGGVIAERFVHVGDYVRPDTRVVTLLVDDPLRLELTVPEANVATIHTGLEVTFETVAFPGRTFTATVKYMGREIREATRDLVVEAVTENPDRVLLPGMFVSAKFPIGEVTLPVVPQKSLVHQEDNESVFVVLDGHLIERIVQLGPKVGEMVAVADGVKKGDLVVVSPPPGATDGASIE